jgi:carbamoyltransferase
MKYADGRMARFFANEVNGRYEVDAATKRWQGWMLDAYNADRVTRQIERALVKSGHDAARLPPVRFLDHHRTHAAGAYLMSGFESCAVLTMDGSGEETCTALWSASGDTLEEQIQFPIPHSLGWYYAAITEYLGFRAYGDEYKVMGLAPYGTENEDLTAALRRLLVVQPESGTYRLDPSYVHYGAHSYSDRFTDALVDLLGHAPRQPETEPTEFHKAVAYSAQRLLEEAALALASRATQTAKTGRVCLAGGTALNCKMSQRILESPGIDDVFVLPNAGDGGQALSAALLLSYELTGRRPARLRSMALGPEFSDSEIKRVIDECLLEAEYVADPGARAAHDIAAGLVVGWFQGRMEFGPRALGNRSILADPRHVSSRDRVNGVVKYREYWRPFCPSILAESADEIFAVRPSDAAFMTITLPVRPQAFGRIPAVVHVDGTSRPQFVHADSHPLFHGLIRSFASITGVPAVLNTSFNVKGEPIVCTPRDAIRNFFSCGMDVLFLGGFRLAKRLVPRVE